MKAAIRQARPSDAVKLIAFVQKLTADPNIDIMLSPGEFTLTVTEEEEVLNRFAQSDNSIFLVAEVGDEITGVLTCSGGKRKANFHTTVLGISIDQAWRNQGIGSQLMAEAIRWVKDTGVVTRIELNVFDTNLHAIHLYQKFGFKIEGRRHKAICRNGKYHNDLIMALTW